MIINFSQKKDLSRRKQKRVSLNVQMEISGRDEHGFRFLCTASTHNVSTEGGCLLIPKDLARGELIRLAGPKGFQFVARVIWANYDYRNDSRQVGFTLIGARNGWILQHGKERPDPFQRKESLQDAVAQ
jgi:hypothetical protein